MLGPLLILALAAAGGLPQLQQPEPLGQDQEPEATLDWETATSDADQWYGRVVTVTGRVVRTKNTGKVVFLNFSEDWKNTCTGVIFASAWCAFAAPPENFFLGKEVRITGRLEEYEGAPEIVIESPRQIAFADGTAVAANPALRPETPLPRGERPPGARLLSWNLENFFDRHDDPYAEDETTQPAFVRHDRKQRIADVLRRLDPDVVCLQEVENRGSLRAFVAEYLPDMGYAVALVEGNDARGIDVAVLSRLPLGAVTSYRHLRFSGPEGDDQRFRRDLLRVRVGPPLDADVYVVHLKSQHGGDPADRIREAEARAAAGILAAEMEADPGYRAVVAGDFNEVPEEETVQTFLRAGLVDPHAGTDRHTYNQEPYLTRIDYALATPALAPEVEVARIVDDVEGVDLRCASDHYPVLLQMRAAPVAPGLTPPAPSEEERVRWEVGVPRLRWPFTAWETRDGFVVVRAPRPDPVSAPGRGTEPDVPVAWTAADAMEGGDPDLRAALALLDSQVIAESAGSARD